MDDQHSILIDVLNELQRALVTGAHREQVNEVLDRLVGFTRMHFASEESLMEKLQFPGTMLHRTEHQRVTERILTETRKLRSGEAVEVAQLLEFLRHCYSQQIEGPDQEYGVWMNEHGVQ